MTDNIRPTLHYTILCDDVRQEAGGKISLMGLFENLYAPKFPALHPRLAVMSEWGEGQGEFRVMMRILSPDRTVKLRETSSTLRLKGPHFRHRDVSVHLNVEFKQPGTYWIENYLDGELMNSMPLTVILVKEQSVH